MKLDLSKGKYNKQLILKYKDEIKMVRYLK